MLVVIGILVVLVGASIGGMSHARKVAEVKRASEVVHQVRTALEMLFEGNDGVWPKTILEMSSASDSIVDEKVAYVLGSRNVYTVTYDSSSKSSTGVDRFGILTPWGADVVKRLGSSASLSSTVGTGGTVKDHLLRFKVDPEGGQTITGASVGGEAVNIRANAAVWCCGTNGKILTYTKGKNGDGIYSWVLGDTVNVR